MTQLRNCTPRGPCGPRPKSVETVHRIRQLPFDAGDTMPRTATGTYVYCLIASARRPSLDHVPRGHRGTSGVRLADVDRGLWLAVADAPLDRFGEEAINRGLSDIDWVSRAAVAHEAVVESFIASAAAVVPMKLFTIFTSDARAVAHIAGERSRIDAVLKRVTNHLEWGVRVVLDRARAAAPVRRVERPAGGVASGSAFLTRKKAQRDAVVELRERARDVVADVYDRFAAQARMARRRTASELPVDGGPLLLDAAFLVPKTRSASFRKLADREVRALERQGYRVKVTGPWPPYSFVEG
jgi:gas vesicle protein GvpL/GvpF